MLDVVDCQEQPVIVKFCPSTIFRTFVGEDTQYRQVLVLGQHNAVIGNPSLQGFQSLFEVSEVVASEVGNLANQLAKVTDEIGKLDQRHPNGDQTVSRRHPRHYGYYRRDQ